MSIYVTIYTKQKGKQELTQNQWLLFWGINKHLTYHREDGPAIEHADGYKEWYMNDKLHREDGPAVEYPNGYGSKEWHIAGEEYSKTNYNKLLKEVDSLEPILGLIDPRDWVRKRFERKYKKAI